MISSCCVEERNYFKTKDVQYLIYDLAVKQPALYCLLWTSSNPKRELQYHRHLLYLTEVPWVISDLPFFQNKDYQY